MHRAGTTKAVFEERHAGLALAIALLEAFLQYMALLVEQEHPRIRHSPGRVAFGNTVDGVVLKDMLVEEPEGTDDLAAFVRQQRIGNAMLGRKTSQHLNGVIADGKRDDVMALEVREALLQLHEL